MEISKIYNLFINSKGVCIDTRKIVKKSIFFAIKGNNFDGNNFVNEALNKGCSYAITDKKSIKKNDKIIYVNNSLQTLQELAKFHRKKLNCPVIGITGTNGKTTTKELINAILKTKYKTTSTTGNYNNHIGVPLTILSTPSLTEILIIEMGANQKNDIKFLCEIAKPTHGIITNIGKAHLEGFETHKNIIKTKKELYDFIKLNNGKLFVNLNDNLLVKLSKNMKSEYYGENNSKIFEQNPFISIFYNTIKINSKLIGSYNYSNILAACKIGTYFGVKIKDCKTAIENYIPSNNRSQKEITKRKNTLILDAYNANPSSMHASIDSFNEMVGEKKILIIGDMLELGNESLFEHQKICDLILKYNFNDTFLIGKEFQKTKNIFKKFETVNDAKKWILNNPIEKSSILLKASRGIKLEDLYSVL